MKHSDIVKQHFDTKYDDYDSLIVKLIPQYQKMSEIVVGLLKTNSRAPKVLELGIGTGLLTRKILDKFSDCHITGIDISQNMLNQAQVNLNPYSRSISLENSDMIDYMPRGEYDICVGLLSIHHLNLEQKELLFRKIFSVLVAGGIFVVGDIIAGDSVKETAELEKRWMKFLLKSVGQDRADYYFKNYQEEDLPSSISEQLRGLSAAGFKYVKCVRRFINTAVLVAIK